jgi:death-on-curing protein
LLAAGLFLTLNGYRLNATQSGATLTMLAVAAGEIDESTFAAWIREHAQRR